MRRLRSGLGLALILLGAAAQPGFTLHDDDGTRPPPGIIATTMTLEHLREARTAAHSKFHLHSLIEDWQTDAGKLAGTEHIAQRESDFRIDDQIGPMLSASGRRAGTRWQQNNNGQVILESGLHPEPDIDARALSTLSSAACTELGETAEPPSAYVVRIHPAGGSLRFVFFDKKSFLITRIEQPSNGTRVTTIYEDFRTTDGYTQAWHVHSLSAETGNESDRRLQSVVVNGPVADDALDIPKASTPVTLVSNGEPLPAKILSDRVIITLRIKGRLVNLQLDSGAYTILIDRSVLDALKIPTYGEAVGRTAGDYEMNHATVPEITFGNVTMRNTVVDAIPFTNFADEHTPVAGLLGFDFIDSVVLHIDYQHGTVTALDPSGFRPPAGSSAIDIRLDDERPIVHAKIGNGVGQNFILDTGADSSALYSAFIKAHPADVIDQGLGTQIRDAYPFETAFHGVGGRVTYHAVQVGPVQFGGQIFPQWVFQGTYNAGTFEGPDFDGLIGQDFLRYFDVYLDYPHAKIYLIPNQRYHDRWG